MDGKFIATVKIWKNGDELEAYVDHGTKAHKLETGHAALKLQKLGATKGQYLYLSFWPNEGDQPAPGFSAKSFHSMTSRYGKSTPETDEFSLPTAKAKTSDKLVMDDQAKKQHADITYYLNGLSYDGMEAYVRMLSVIPTRSQAGTFQGAEKDKLANGKWQLSKKNCAHAVYECLVAGGAPASKFAKVMTPNRLAEYCDWLMPKLGVLCQKIERG